MEKENLYDDSFDIYEKHEKILKFKIESYIKELFVNYRLYEIDGIDLIEITTKTDEVFESLTKNCINRIGVYPGCDNDLTYTKFIDELTDYDTIFLGDNKC